MINKIIKYFFLVCAIMALEVPVQAPKDSRMKAYVYDSEYIYDLNLVIDFKTELVLDPEEQINRVVFGNGKGIDVLVDKSANVIFFKPMYVGIDTNLMIETDKRKYRFAVRSHRKEGVADDILTYILSFKYSRGCSR